MVSGCSGDLFILSIYQGLFIRVFFYVSDRKYAIIRKTVFFVQTNVQGKKTKLNRGRVIKCYLLLNQ